MSSESIKQHGWVYRFGIAALVIVLITIIGPAFNYQRLIRLYRVITLFDENVIVDNFRNMDDIFAKKIVLKAEKPSSFERELRPLPETFHYNGQEFYLQDFWKDQWKTGLVVMKEGRKRRSVHYIQRPHNIRLCCHGPPFTLVRHTLLTYMMAKLPL